MIKALKKLIIKYRKIILYGCIGISSVVVDLLVFYLLFNSFGVVAWLSTVISVSVATFYSFILNAFYNFKTTDRLRLRLVSFIAVSAIGMALSVALIELITNRFGVSANIAKPLSLPPIVVIQYLLNANITFSNKKNLSQTVTSPKPTKPKTWKAQKSVAVIGAGYTGLTIAYELLKKGYQVTIIEKSDTLGGLVAGFDLEGVPLERAYHFLYKTDSDILSLLEELGIRDKLKFHSSSLSLYYDGKLFPFMTPMDLLKFTPLNFFDRIRAGVIALYLTIQKRWRPFARVTAMDWMNKWAGKKVTKVIWEPILKGKFFNYFDKVAMSYVWSRVYVRAHSKDKGEVTEKLGYFDGGWRILTEKLEEKIREMGGVIRTGVTLTGIKEDQAGTVAVHSTEETLKFDACIATTPTHIFSRLIQDNKQITPAYTEKLNSVDYIGAITLIFATNKAFTNYYWHNINDINHPFLVLLSLSALVGAENLDGKHISYVGAYLPHDHELFSKSKQEIYDLWMAGVKEIFPDFDESTVTSWDLFKFKNAQHIVDVDYEEKIPAYESVVPNVYLSNFSQIFPDDRGTNYAVQEGKKVAKIVDENLVERGDS